MILGLMKVIFVLVIIVFVMPGLLTVRLFAKMVVMVEEVMVTIVITVGNDSDGWDNDCVR